MLQVRDLLPELADGGQQLVLLDLAFGALERAVLVVFVRTRFGVC